MIPFNYIPVALRCCKMIPDFSLSCIIKRFNFRIGNKYVKSHLEGWNKVKILISLTILFLFFYFIFKNHLNFVFVYLNADCIRSVKILKALLHSFILTTWPAHINLIDLITLNILSEWYKLYTRSSSLWSLLHSFSCLLGPNVCLRILFLNTLRLLSSLTVRDHVSQPYSTTGNIIVIYK